MTINHTSAADAAELRSTSNRRAGRVRRKPFTTLDSGGRKVVIVPLAGGQSAKLFPDDFAAIRRAGFSDQWVFNLSGRGHPYVRVGCARVSGSLLSVARIILSPGHGKRVRYRDGNPLNLRRDNLYVTAGRAFGREEGEIKRRDMEAADAAAAPFVADVEDRPDAFV